MNEGKVKRVKRLARQSRSRYTAICGIGHQRVTQARHVDTNLMGSPRLQGAFHQTSIFCVLKQTNAGRCWLSCVSAQINNRHAQPIAWITPYGRFDLAKFRT